MQTKEIQLLYEASMKKAAEIIPSFTPSQKECSTVYEYAIEYAAQFDYILNTLHKSKHTKQEEDIAILQGLNNALTVQNSKYEKNIEALNKQLLLYKTTSGKVVDNKIALMETKTKTEMRQLKGDYEHMQQQLISKDESIKKLNDEIERLKKLFKAFNTENMGSDKLSSDKLLEEHARNGIFEYNIFIKGQMQPEEIPNQDLSRIVKMPMGHLIHLLSTQSKKMEELIARPAYKNEELTLFYNELKEKHLALSEEKEYLTIEIKTLIERQIKIESKYNKIASALRELISNTLGNCSCKEDMIKMLDILQSEESILSQSPLLSPEIQPKKNMGLQIEYLKALHKDNKYKEFADLWRSYNYDDAFEIEDSNIFLCTVVRIRDKQIEELIKRNQKYTEIPSTKSSPSKNLNVKMFDVEAQENQIKQILTNCIDKLSFIYPYKSTESNNISSNADCLSYANRLLVMIDSLSNITKSQHQLMETINQIYELYSSETDSPAQKDSYFNDIYTAVKELLFIVNSKGFVPNKVSKARYTSENLEEANTAIITKDKMIYSKEENKQIEKSLQAKDQLIMTLRSENDRISSTLHNKDQELQNSKQEFDQRLLDLSSRLSEQQEKQVTILEEANKLREAYKQACIELEQAKQSIHTQSFKIEEISKEANSKLEELRKYKANSQAFEKDKSTLEAQIKENRKTSDNARLRLEAEIKELKIRAQNSHEEVAKYEEMRASYNSVVEAVYNIRDELFAYNNQGDENIEKALGDIKSQLKEKSSKIDQLQNAMNILNCENQAKSKESVKSKNSMVDYWKAEAEMEKSRRKQVEEELNKMIDEHNRPGTIQIDESMSNILSNYLTAIDENISPYNEKLNAMLIKNLLSQGVEYINRIKHQLEIERYNNNLSAKDESSDIKKRSKWLEEENQKLRTKLKSLDESLSKSEKSYLEQQLMIESQNRRKEEAKTDGFNSQLYSLKEEIYTLNGIIVQLQKERDDLSDLNVKAKQNINNLADALAKEHEQQKDLGKELKILHEAFQNKSKKKPYK